MKKSLLFATALGLFVVSFVASSHAASYTYTGPAGGQWYAANWTDGVSPYTPAAGPFTDTYTINNGNGVIYTPGGDFRNKGVLNIDGAGSSWSQATNNGAWLKIGDDTGGAGNGTINITNGGSFTGGSGSANPTLFLGNGPTNGFVNVGTGSSFSHKGTLEIRNTSIFTTAGTTTITGSVVIGNGTQFVVNGGSVSVSGAITRNATSTLTVNNGTVGIAGDFINNTATNGTFTLAGGVVNIGNEFKPISTFTLSAGTLNVANLISFADGPGSINFSGGNLGLNGAGPNSGFYGGGTKSLNFTLGSTGVLTFNTYTLAELTTDGFLTNGTIRLNGAVSAGSFTVTQVGPNVTVALVAVPEPSTYAAIIGVACFGLIYLRRRQAARAS
jgi:hypothetical protein